MINQSMMLKGKKIMIIIAVIITNTVIIPMRVTGYRINISGNTKTRINSLKND